MILYLLTISCQQKNQFVSKEDLDEVINWLKLSEESLHVWKHSYERTGRYTQLHFHAIVSVRSGFYWKPYIQYGDRDYMHLTFRVQWKRCGHFPGAVKYIYKDTHNSDIVQDQIFNENMYKYHYFNIDNQTLQLITTFTT